MSAQAASKSEIVDKFIAAYNAKDFARYRELMSPKFYFRHYNRDFEHNDRDDFIATLKLFATDLVPDRKFGPPTLLVESGNTVVRTHKWGGTAQADIPGMAAKGERLELDLCSIFVFDGGLIAEYHDYG